MVSKGKVFVGFNNTTKLSGSYEVTEDLGKKRYIVVFCNGYIKNCHYKEVLSGGIKNPTYPQVYKVGYLGEGRFTAKDRYKGNRWNSPAYEVWIGILKRCYNTKAKGYPIYGGSGCRVSEDWLNFQSFANWYYNQSQNSEIFKWAIDKDLKVKGNKLYSKETCELIPYAINSLFTGATVVTGATYKPKINKWVAQIQRGSLGSTGKKRQDYLGAYGTEDEAIAVYTLAKVTHTINTANRYKNFLPKIIYDKLTDKDYIMEFIISKRGEA